MSSEKDSIEQMSQNESNTIKTFKLKKLSKKFNFIVKVENREKDWCSGKANVIVTDKKGKKIQKIISEDCVFELSKNNLPWVNSLNKAAYLFLKDFNFDGHNDLAVITEMGGGYGGPTFSIYLFNPGKNKFVYSKDFTEASWTDNCNYIFTVDKKHKRLITYQRGGIGYLDTRKYIVVNNKIKQVYHKSTSPD